MGARKDNLFDVRWFVALVSFLTGSAIGSNFRSVGQEAGAHPIIGIIVLALAVIQPIMALFRPHPGEDKYEQPRSNFLFST